MISALHFDHRAAVYRFTEQLSTDGLRAPERTFSQVDGLDSVPMAFQARIERWDDQPSGQKVRGEWRAYAEAGVDVQEGDVVEVFDGPSAPQVLEVDSAYTPRGHHLQLILRPFDGDLEA